MLGLDPDVHGRGAVLEELRRQFRPNFLVGQKFLFGHFPPPFLCRPRLPPGPVVSVVGIVRFTLAIDFPARKSYNPNRKRVKMWMRYL